MASLFILLYQCDLARKGDTQFIELRRVRLFSQQNQFNKQVRINNFQL